MKLSLGLLLLGLIKPFYHSLTLILEKYLPNRLYLPVMKISKHILFRLVFLLHCLRKLLNISLT